MYRLKKSPNDNYGNRIIIDEPEAKTSQKKKKVIDMMGASKKVNINTYKITNCYIMLILKVNSTKR